MNRFRFNPFIKKRIHIHGKVLDHRQITQRFDCQLIVLEHLFDMGPTGPARNAIDHHRAGTTHADTAGITIGQGRITILLNPGDHIKDSLTFAGRNLELFEPTGIFTATPNRDIDGLLIRRQLLFLKLFSTNIIECSVNQKD